PEPGDRQRARLDHRALGGARDAAADDRRRPLPARRGRPRVARARQGLDPRRADRLRTRGARAGARLDRAADRRRMRQRTLLIAILAAAALLALPGAALSDRSAATAPTTTTSPSPPSPTTPTQTQ